MTDQETQRIYRGGFWLLAVIPVIIYLSNPPELPALGHGYRGGALHIIWNTLSQLAGLTGMAALAVSFILSSRYKPLEMRLGGLDKMYRLHHRLGITAFILLVAHPLFFSLRFIPQRIGHFFSFWLPVHRDFPVNLGVIAFWLFVLLIVLTLVRRFPYRWWKQSHRFMGIVLLIGGWHMLTMTETSGRVVASLNNGVLYYYMLIVMALGFISYCYREVWVPLIKERFTYKVREIARMPSGIMSIQLEPVNESLKHESGQFVFARFEQSALPREQHPFTICSPTSDETKIITVKVLGDFTKQLYEELEEGATVYLEGPYGQFDFRKGGSRQIWLAGGIGVTPFVCWLHELYNNNENRYQIEFYYCIHAREETIYHRELEKWANHLTGVQFHLVCTGEEGHLTGDQIMLDESEVADVFICGPLEFLQDLQAQLEDRGIPAEQIHHEEFEFR